MEKKNEKWKEIIKGKTEKLRSAFEKKGMAGLSQLIAGELNKWKNESINIAILGQAGVGKSTFINALRNLTGDDAGAAKVGCAAETTEPRYYLHPKNDKVRIWDFPGVGCVQFPKKEYLKMINFEIFDFFIIMTSKRFSEIDIWLAQEVEKSGKCFYFVRSMFGNDIENEMQKKKKKMLAREDLVNKSKQMVLRDCEKNLQVFNCEDKIFILDSYEKNSYDFEKLETKLIHDAYTISDEKQLAITSCLSVTTKSSIEEKKIVLENRIPKIALRAAFSLRINDNDLLILKNEMQFYKQQFNLDEASLQRDVEVSNLKELFSDIKLELQGIDTRSSEIDEFNEIDKLIPFLPFFNIWKSYKASKIWLKKTLDMIAQTAAEVNVIMMDSLAQS